MNQSQSRSSEQGATSVEYAIMVTLIAVVVIAAVAIIGVTLRSDFDCTGSVISASQPDPSSQC